MQNILQTIHLFFLKQSRSSNLLIILSIVTVFGYLDYITGFEITFSFFYLIPMIIAAWYLGKNTGYFIALLCIIIWVATNWAAGEKYSNEIIRYWNAFFRLSIFLIIIWLVEEFKRALLHERLLAQTDYLTGIPNSREFYFQANAELMRASRSKQPITVAYIDVDFFKQINDQFGHMEGDSVLRAIAQSIRANIRKTDIVARLGGDEFAILLPNTDQNGAKYIMDKVLSKLAEQMERMAFNVTLSIGVVSFGLPPESVDDMLRKSDAILYEAKSGGKNKVIFFQS